MLSVQGITCRVGKRLVNLPDKKPLGTGRKVACRATVTWNTLFCKGLKEIHVEIVNVTCTGHEQSGLKDLDASLGCYHPKRTKVYNPAVWITTGKCSAAPPLKKRDERLGCYCPKHTNSRVYGI